MHQGSLACARGFVGPTWSSLPSNPSSQLPPCVVAPAAALVGAADVFGPGADMIGGALAGAAVIVVNADELIAGAVTVLRSLRAGVVHSDEATEMRGCAIAAMKAVAMRSRAASGDGIEGGKRATITCDVHGGD